MNRLQRRLAMTKRVQRHVVKITREGTVTYLAKGEEVTSQEDATPYTAPSKAYDAMDDFGKKLLERDPIDRKAVFMEVEPTFITVPNVVGA